MIKITVLNIPVQIVILLSSLHEKCSLYVNKQGFYLDFKAGVVSIKYNLKVWMTKVNKFVSSYTVLTILSRYKLNIRLITDFKIDAYQNKHHIFVLCFLVVVVGPFRFFNYCV